MVKPKKRYGPMKVIGSKTGQRQKLVYFTAAGSLKSATFSLKNVKRVK